MPDVVYYPNSMAAGLDEIIEPLILTTVWRKAEAIFEVRKIIFLNFHFYLLPFPNYSRLPSVIHYFFEFQTGPVFFF